MPVIPEYTSPTDTLRPTETGVEALAMAGRRAGAFFDQAATSIRQSAQDQARAAFAEASGKEERARAFGRTAKDFAELGEQAETAYAHHEISQGAAAFAQRHSDLTDAWNDIANKSDPNDTSIKGKFIEGTLEPALDQFRQAFNTQQGQQWAESHIEALRNHFFEKTDADMATRAGDAVVTNLTKLSNSMTNTARNDPSSVPFLLDTADSSVTGIVSSSPNLKGAASAKARTEGLLKLQQDIVRAGALGAIEKAPDKEAAVAAWAKRYPDLINAQELDQFAKAARSFQRMDQEGARAAQAEQRRQGTAAFHQAANKWELSTIDESGNATLPPDAVKQLKDMATTYGQYADPSRITAMVHRVQELGKTLDPASAANLKKTSDTNERDLRTRMVMPGGEPVTESDINTAYSKNQLSYAARNRLLKDYRDDTSPDGETLAKSRTDFFRNYAATIDPGRDQTTGAGASALGNQKIGEAQQEARRLEGVLRSQNKDPHSLYDPKSPDFFGNQVSRFRATLQEKAAFDAQVKADADRKQAIPGTITNIDVKEAPPRPKGFPDDATRGSDGNWYVVRDGKRFRVDPK